MNDLPPDELKEYVDILYAAKQHPSRYATIGRETLPGTVPPMYKNVTVYNLFVWIHYYISKETYGKMSITNTFLINDVSMVPIQLVSRQNYHRYSLKVHVTL